VDLQNGRSAFFRRFDYTPIDERMEAFNPTKDLAGLGLMRFQLNEKNCQV
jgi:hypothetical protein